MRYLPPSVRCCEATGEAVNSPRWGEEPTLTEPAGETVDLEELCSEKDGRSPVQMGSPHPFRSDQSLISSPGAASSASVMRRNASAHSAKHASTRGENAPHSPLWIISTAVS